MRSVSIIVCIGIIACVMCNGLNVVQAQTIEELERQLEENPASARAKEALAEAYLEQCYLEKSLALWMEILKGSPNHKRAAVVVDRLTVQKLDLDSHLTVLAMLIEKGMAREADAMISAAIQRAATDSQKARIFYLRGQVALRMSKLASAKADFKATMMLYPESNWAARAAIALAEGEKRQQRTDDAYRLLRQVVENQRLTEEAIREEARLKLLLLDSEEFTSQEKVDGLRGILSTTTTNEVRRQVLLELTNVLKRIHERWTPEAIEAIEAVFESSPPYDESADLLRQLREVVHSSQDSETLDSLMNLLSNFRHQDASLIKEAAFIHAEALLSRAAVEDQMESVNELLSRAHKILDLQEEGEAGYRDSQRASDLRGRAYLVEAQKLVTLKSSVEALPSLQKAKDHYIIGLRSNPQEAYQRLQNIGKLLEHVQEWEMAVSLYEEIAAAYPHHAKGRDALLRAAKLHHERLDAPLNALERYAEYAARYPAELPYRQLQLGNRLSRLGYSNLLDLQKGNGLKPDGIYGPISRQKLRELEASFDMICARPEDNGKVLRGEFVHPTMYKIARRLEADGHHYEATMAYRLFINLFPTKKEADDASISIARLFRDNQLYDEAVGAYEELIDDYPEGNQTSEAYIEIGECYENLGDWDKAEEYYKLYIKKFPKYKHVKFSKNRLAFLKEIRQYQDFIESNPESHKLAEAQYQIGTTLYKKCKNYRKASVEFSKVAIDYPEHVRAADALFTAGTALLREENFQGAREKFEELVQRFSATRLADDGQYWIGHTYEYSARAMGKLDKKRIVLKRRTQQSGQALLNDLMLRRHYFANAKKIEPSRTIEAGVNSLGVLTSGSIRDRVNAELFRAIRAYRVVVEKFKRADMAGKALLRIGDIYTKYLKDPEQGIKAYQELLEHYPGSKEAVDAVHEVGEYLLEKKQYDKAVEMYHQFIYNYPRDTRVEEAMLAIAQCYVEKKTWDKALDAYQGYLNKFPKGKLADFGRAQVEWIRMYHF